MKRKLIASLLALSMLAMSLAGCGNDSSSGSGTSGSGTESQSGGGADSDDGAGVDQDALDQEADALGLPPMTTDEITLTYACSVRINSYKY